MNTSNNLNDGNHKSQMTITNGNHK